ncbi:DUF4810 domain-containing protein [Azoarcus indigens]|uniref:DUF4810 domain-containing protein n=1 Tax=Azoarcus indigens TaxID=29545 RepID=A0A4R6DHG8_9RHOO|nr:DUF4810 domain-containing protein [Azoarcus indigens]NMG67955.1 DUF4810 domain-containing protein [Azoarcus indigens]TDN43764.1 hypothetical protein C7389_1389 [Azoarcus indigens]
MPRLPAQRTLLALLATSALLAGCATQRSLYHWGNFPDQQYAYLKGDKGPEEEIQELEKIREQAKAAGQALPPGLQAHLGMLYGVTGRADLFVANLEAERQQFPESGPYVDFLLKKKTPQ